MIRTVVTTDNNTLTLAIAKDEGVEDSVVSKKKVSFTVLHTDIKNYKFNRDDCEYLFF